MKKKSVVCRLVYVVRVAGSYASGFADMEIKGVKAFKRCVKEDWRVVKPLLTEVVGDEVTEVVELEIYYDGKHDRLCTNVT